MTPQELKKLIKEEYLKCSLDPVYFMVKYCYISHPVKGKIKFDLYDFQKQTLKLFKNNRYKIILKSRQLGISTLVAGYSLWLMLFHSNKNVLVVCTKQATSRNLVSSVSYMYDNLPQWLQIKTTEKNVLSMGFINNSRIKAVSASPDAGRSEACSLLVLDESAFISSVSDIWTSTQSTLSTGGEAIVLSTPNGVGNWFHQMWTKAENGENEFITIKLPWYLHPDRDQVWRNQQDELLGIKKASQECDCNFLSSGDTVFDLKELDTHNPNIQEPIMVRGITRDLWIWKTPEPDKNYIITADVARGDASDYSTCHIIDIENWEQVGEFKSQIDTRDFANLLLSLGYEYNQALLVIENLSIGWDVVKSVVEANYPNMYYSPKGNDSTTYESYMVKSYDETNTTPGFSTTQRTRPLLINALYDIVRKKEIIIRSKRTLDELKTFIWKHGKAQAMDGYNDDLIIPLGIACYLRDTVLLYKQQGNDLTRAVLGGIYKDNQYSSNDKHIYSYGSNLNNKSYSPYTMKLSNGQVEDFSWMLK